MKYALVLITALALVGCKDKEQAAVNTFASSCAAAKGVLTHVSADVDKCTLPDGKVELSK